MKLAILIQLVQAAHVSVMIVTDQFAVILIVVLVEVLWSTRSLSLATAPISSVPSSRLEESNEWVRFLERNIFSFGYIRHNSEFRLVSIVQSLAGSTNLVFKWCNSILVQIYQTAESPKKDRKDGKLPNDGSFAGSRWNFKKIKNLMIYVLIPMAVVALVLSMLAFAQMNESGHLRSDSIESSMKIGYLAVTGDGLALRIGSEKCDGEYCDDVESIYCQEEGALKIFHEADGELLCVCDGKAWNCDMTVCSASGLESAIHEARIFGVIKTNSCDQTKSDESCDTWACEADLHRVHDVEIKCGKSGWEAGEDALCVCQSNVLFATLAMDGNEFVNVTRCDKTPAGEICGKGYWFCPHQLLQEGEFECNKKDGSWAVPEHPCICSDDYAKSGEIQGFEKSCGYLAVGQSCAHNKWECEDLLIPSSSLECTTYGLVGECGCSADELEKLLASADAIVSGCDKTSIGEVCTDWDCRDSDKLCCSSPTCTEDGSWSVDGDMCQPQDAITCDLDDLADYFPISCLEDTPSGLACSVRCNVSISNPFTCPGLLDTCSALCQSDGTWDVPCSCAGLGEIMGCSTEAECVGFDPWGCENYEIGKSCTPADYCLGSLEFRRDSDTFESALDQGTLLCTGTSSWAFKNGTAISDPLVFPDLCACPISDVCDLLGGNGGCIGSDMDYLGVGSHDCLDTTRDCGFACTKPRSFYTGGEIICNSTGAFCPTNDCNCCLCDVTACINDFDQVLCGDPQTCSNQTAVNTSSECPVGSIPMGLCNYDEAGGAGAQPTICLSCFCQDSTCRGESDGPLCMRPNCGGTGSGPCNYPNMVAGQCLNETCIPL